ncbi:MAG: SDR family NAD(P)-dependent oxidoreductase [Caulobacteraceae bacterium]
MDSVIVTGGSRGLGLGVAKTLAAQGYRVIAVARSPSDALRAAQADSAKAGTGEIHFTAWDLSDIGTLGELAKHIKAEHGAPFGLVNNAGVGTAGVLANMRPSDIEGLIRLNTTSPIVLTRFLVGSMMARSRGRIVNMASIIASTGYSGLSVYGATKASLVGFTKSLAREVGRAGVTVNAVAPGFIDTELTSDLEPDARARIAGRSALRRLAEVDDVAAAVAYLVSDAAKNITGAVLTVDAGNSA